MQGDQDSLAYVHANRQIRYASTFAHEDAKLYTIIQNAYVFSYYTGNNDKQRLDSAKSYYMRVIEEAKERHRPVYECKAYADLSKLGDRLGNDFPFTQLAASADSIANLLHSDSLRVIADLAMGNSFMTKNKMDTAYRYFNSAVSLADDLKDSVLKRNCYIAYANLYFKYDKYSEAIVNVSKALAIDSSKSIHNVVNSIQDYVMLAEFHSAIPDFGPQMARDTYSDLLFFASSPKIECLTFGLTILN